MDLSQEFPELPSGPLDVYRKRASFNWKGMLRFMEGEEIIALKVIPKVFISLFYLQFEDFC